MNNKAQTAAGVGVFITLFITIIVGVILLIAVAQSIGETLDTSTQNSSTNGLTYTVPADGITIDLVGQELLSTPVVHNGTADSVQVISVGNYTIDEGVSTSTGVKTIRYTAVGSEFDGHTMNVSYNYGADGYVENSGARGMIGMIVVFFALAIALIALEPTLRSGIIDKMGI